MKNNIIEKLKARYKLHPLIFHRSLEKSSDASELFDILDSFPKKFPVVWDQKSKRWKYVSDVTSEDSFDMSVIN